MLLILSKEFQSVFVNLLNGGAIALHKILASSVPLSIFL